MEGTITSVALSDVKINATYADIQNALKSKGYRVPDSFTEDNIRITITDSVSEFDATTPGGLQMAKSVPVIHWWSKYTVHHGIVPSTIPGRTLAVLNESGTSITVAGVEICFHRTLRVPESTNNNALPASWGLFPLVPVARYAHRLPEIIRSKGGFLMPMYQREAMWMAFNCKQSKSPAVKISVGGVNAITGIAHDLPTPPRNEQDYIVAGLQPWIDGVVTESGVVRQFVAMSHGQNYTVEEQVTKEVKHGGLQFDIFPRREEPYGGGKFYRVDQTGAFQESFQSHMTPKELKIPIGSSIELPPWDLEPHPANSWTLSSYKRRINGDLCAVYLPPPQWIRASSPRVVLTRSSSPEFCPSMSLHSSTPRRSTCLMSKSENVTSLGMAIGGKIAQKIYRDGVSPRMYDEENGHRFHVHIISPEAWEIVTGVLPPITPITAKAYMSQNIPWYLMSDQNVPDLDMNSYALGNLQPVAQLDKQFSQLPGEIDPDDPPMCSVYPQMLSTSIFRPCSHTACPMCLGTALQEGSQCPRCMMPIERFVGLKKPIAQVAPVRGELEDNVLAWNVLQMEEFAHKAADSNNISIIHLEGDRVSPLFNHI